MNPIPRQMARLSGTQGLDGRTIRQLFSMRLGETPGISPTKSRHTEGLPAHRELDQFHRGPGSSGLKRQRTSAPKPTMRPTKKTRFLGNHGKAADPAPDEECTRTEKR